MVELSGAASLFLVAIVLLRIVSIEKRVAALSQVDAKLDLLLKQAGIAYDPFKNWPPQVTDALQRGEKIQAIKHYREATGVSLKQAKDDVEEIQRRAGRGV